MHIHYICDVYRLDYEHRGHLWLAIHVQMTYTHNTKTLNEPTHKHTPLSMYKRLTHITRKLSTSLHTNIRRYPCTNDLHTLHENSQRAYTQTYAGRFFEQTKLHKEEGFMYSVFTKDTLDEKGQARDTRVHVTLYCLLSRQRILQSPLAEIPSFSRTGSGKRLSKRYV